MKTRAIFCSLALLSMLTGFSQARLFETSAAPV